MTKGTVQNKIALIKALRDATHLGLKDAKDIIDALLANSILIHPHSDNFYRLIRICQSTPRDGLLHEKIVLRFLGHSPQYRKNVKELAALRDAEGLSMKRMSELLAKGTPVSTTGRMPVVPGCAVPT